MRRPASQNKRVGVLQMAFRARKVFGTFEKRAPGHVLLCFQVTDWHSTTSKQSVLWTLSMFVTRFDMTSLFIVGLSKLIPKPSIFVWQRTVFMSLSHSNFVCPLFTSEISFDFLKSSKLHDFLTLVGGEWGSERLVCKIITKCTSYTEK